MLPTCKSQIRRLWAENYDRELTAENLFTIQREISHEIVRALQVVLTDEEDERLQAIPTTSLEAYGEFVLGRQELAKRTPDALHQAQTHFEMAIELDRGYALAYIGLADSLGLQADYADLNEGATFAARQAAIDSALALYPLSGEAYASLAYLKMHEFKDEEAEQYYLKAIELSPNYANAHQWYSLHLNRGGRQEEALPHIRKAVEFDPMAPILTMRLAQVLSGLGRVEEAQAILLKGIERNPQFPHNYRHLAAQLLALGRVGEALRWYRAGIRLAPSLIRSRIYECSFWLQLGDDRSAEHCLDSVEETFSQRAFGSRVDLHLFRAEFQEAVELGEQLAQRELDPYARSILAWLYVINGEADKAMSIWQDMEAELFGDEDVIIEPNELWKTALVAQTLYVDGQLDRANYLFDHALETMQSMHRIRGIGYAARTSRACHRIPSCAAPSMR